MKFLRYGKIPIGPFAALAAASVAMGQQYTLSARPGLVNYVEGQAALNGNLIDTSLKSPVFVNAGDTFATFADDNSKAEILLMPGVFLRLGNSSQIRMVAPSLVNTRLELMQGEAIVEAVGMEAGGMMRGTQVEVIVGRAQVTIATSGLYRIRADSGASAAVFDGKISVAQDGQILQLGKRRQTPLGQELRSEKLQMDEVDDLYAWSSVRSEYEAAASYQAALLVASTGQNQTGWYFDDLLDSWAWLPSQVFFNSFGWGFYPTGSVWRAPVVVCTVLRGGHWGTRPRPIGIGQLNIARHWVGMASTREVPINPKHPPVLNFVAGTPNVEKALRSGQQVSMISPSNGTRKANGSSQPASRLQSSHTQVRIGGGGSSRASSGGGSSIGSHSGGGSSSSSSGGHSGGGASTSGGGSSSHK